MIRISELLALPAQPLMVPTEADTAALWPRAIDAPVRWHDGERISYREAKRRIRGLGGFIRRPVVRFGDWIVCRGSVDALSRPYWVETDRLSEDWEEHFAGKSWPRDEIVSACAAIRSARREAAL